MKIPGKPIIIRNPDGKILLGSNNKSSNNQEYNNEEYNNQNQASEEYNNQDYYNLQHINSMINEMFLININCSVVKIIIFMDFLIGVSYYKNSFNILDILINIMAFHSTTSLNKYFLIPFLCKYYLFALIYFNVSISCNSFLILNKMFNNTYFIIEPIYNPYNENNCFYNNITCMFYILNTTILQRFFIKVSYYKVIYENLLYLN